MGGRDYRSKFSKIARSLIPSAKLRRSRLEYQKFSFQIGILLPCRTFTISQQQATNAFRERKRIPTLSSQIRRRIYSEASLQFGEFSSQGRASLAEGRTVKLRIK